VPIDFEPALLEAFFGLPRGSSRERVVEEGTHVFEYSGPKLRYCLMVDSVRLTAMISGDTSTPFGESLYEIGVPCSSIRITPLYGDAEHTKQVGEALAFYYDIMGQPRRTLTIFKRRDGELVVWPSVPYPLGHPNASCDDFA
jgi:hypothetical protein